MQPDIRYARSGAVNIAYRVVGRGPLDLVVIPGWISHLEGGREDPTLGLPRFGRRLAAFARVIAFDKRGTGLSDRVRDLPTLEQRMDDVRAVLDAVGSERAALLGISEGGSMSVLFAATYPERTTALVLCGAFARRAWAPDYPWGRTAEQLQRHWTAIEESWGGPVDVDTMAPSIADDPQFRQWWASYLRLGASPGAALALQQMNAEIDIRHVLPAIHVPTLVLHRTGDRMVAAAEGRYLADRIPGAKYVELPGVDHLPFVGDTEGLLNEIEEFLTGMRPIGEPDRVLATVLFTDIVGSTTRAAELGDRRWRILLEEHHALVRKELARFRGREIDTAGDGFLATFDGPARAIGCATAITKAVQELGLEIRAGLHTGECERLGDKIAGIAVHIGARVAAAAGPGEVLVTSTVKDLVAGSGLRFADRGVRSLKGVPEDWHLFAVEPGTGAQP